MSKYEGHTPGPWAVFEEKVPYKLHGVTRYHIERRIGTVQIHPQLKDRYPIVTLSTGLGMEADKPVRMVSIDAANAALIADAPQLLKQRDALREALQMLLDYQNGCPLPKYEKRWNEAVTLSRAALALCDDQRDK